MAPLPVTNDGNRPGGLGESRARPDFCSYRYDLPLLAGLAADRALHDAGAVCGGAAVDVDAPPVAHVDQPEVSACRCGDQTPPLVRATVVGPLDKCSALAGTAGAVHNFSAPDTGESG